MLDSRPDRVSATEQRYESERQFHDRRFADDRRAANRFYSIIGAADDHYGSRLDAAPPGATFLDCGCGSGAYAAIRLAEQGRRVSAIDLSSVAIEEARTKARRRALEDRIEFRVMNAEALEFPDHSFTVVCGSGVLHHLDLRRAYAEIARVLKPSGHGIFLEPMGHNALINLYRRLTPEQRTPDERPLLASDFELARQFFDRVETTHFALASLLALPVAHTRTGRQLLSWLDALDQRIFRRVPAARRFGWLVVLDLAEPRNEVP